MRAKAKVSQLDARPMTLSRHEDVSRLDVTMDKAEVVGIGQRIERLTNH